MKLYHVTTSGKVKRYHHSRRIISPVRGFTTLQAAMAWAIKTKRNIILSFEAEKTHKMPDHHNMFGEAWWNDEDIKEWKCEFSAEKDG